MRQIIKRLKTCKNFAKQVEEVYERVKRQRGEPQPWLVFLPVAYKNVIDRESPNIDETAITLVGQYFGTRYPEIKEYFMSETQRTSLDSIRTTLDDFFSEDPYET